MRRNGIEGCFDLSGGAGRAMKARLAGMLLTGLCLGYSAASRAAPGDGATPPPAYIAKTDYAAHKPDELVAYNFRSPSDFEKAAVRSYLARIYAETEAGLFAPHGDGGCSFR